MPFVLDFDLDCFTTECDDKTYAWPEDIFKKKYFDNENVRYFMRRLIERSTIITICRFSYFSISININMFIY